MYGPCKDESTSEWRICKNKKFRNCIKDQELKKIKKILPTEG
jgi:hypothetical protein